MKTPCPSCATVHHPMMTRAMRTSPGQTFQLLDNAGHPAEIGRADFAALSRACPRPFRIQSRTASRSAKTCHVWVSMDPGHWERISEARKKKAAS